MKEYYTPSERLELVIKSLARSQKEFCEATGLQPSIVSRICKGQFPLSEIRVQAIIKAYPEVNPQFLRDGTSYPGDISLEVVRANLTKVIKERDNTIAVLTKELELLQRVVDKLTR